MKRVDSRRMRPFAFRFSVGDEVLVRTFYEIDATAALKLAQTWALRKEYTLLGSAERTEV
jgi:hypothetical protein